VVVSEELKSFINKIRITRIAERTGIDKKKIQEWAQLLLEDEHITVLLGSSILSSGWSSQTVRITAELLSLLNENGAMDMGCLPHRGPGFEPVEDAGRSTTEILQGCMDGSIKALFLFDADVMEDYPDQSMVEKALASVPFVVCAGSYLTKTTDYASVFLPLSMVSEEDGTYTNFSGRVQRSLKALPQLDGSLSGCQLLLALGERWGLGWKQVHVSQITNMIAQAVSHYAGLTWEHIGHEGQSSQNVAKKYVDAIPGLILPEDALDEDPSDDFPYRWVRGPFLFDLSGNKPYAKALVERSEPCTVRIHPFDANELGVKENSSLTLKGDLGDVKLPVEITSATAQGCVTVLGKYKDIAVNRIASPERPWVKINR